MLSDGAFVQKEASGFPFPSTIQILILAPGLKFHLLWFKKKHHERILSSLFLRRFIPSEKIQVSIFYSD